MSLNLIKITLFAGNLQAIFGGGLQVALKVSILAVDVSILAVDMDQTISSKINVALCILGTIQLQDCRTIDLNSKMENLMGKALGNKYTISIIYNIIGIIN